MRKRPAGVTTMSGQDSQSLKVEPTSCSSGPPPRPGTAAPGFGVTGSAATCVLVARNTASRLGVICPSGGIPALAWKRLIASSSVWSPPRFVSIKPSCFRISRVSLSETSSFSTPSEGSATGVAPQPVASRQTRGEPPRVVISGTWLPRDATRTSFAVSSSTSRKKRRGFSSKFFSRDLAKGE